MEVFSAIRDLWLGSKLDDGQAHGDHCVNQSGPLPSFSFYNEVQE